MTDDEWFAATAPEPLLAWLRDRANRDDSSRTVFLYASACYRLNWDDHDPTIRAVVEMLESRAQNPNTTIAPRSFLTPFLQLFAGDLTGAVSQVLALSGAGAWMLAEMATQATRPLGATPFQQADLLRELQSPPSITPQSFLSEWQTENLRSLVRQIGDFHDYHLLPIIGDLLQESGCTDSAIVSHCQSNTVHRHGCWVIEGLAASLRVARTLEIV